MNSWRYRVLTSTALLLSSVALAYSAGGTNSAKATSPAAPSFAALAATVYGTPPAERWEVPDKVPAKVRRLDMKNARPTPPVFWYDDALEYSVALQDGPAPWVFLIAGTGSSWSSGKMVFLQAALWAAGYHVACLSSSTHPNFMVTTSASGTPGLLIEDAQDLRRVMQEIYEVWRTDAPATGFGVVGYSLGATQAAAVANLDPITKGPEIKAVVMLNPAVDLYESAGRLDAMLAHRFPGGEKEVVHFLDRVIESFGEVYQQLPGTDIFSDDFLFSAVSESQHLTAETLEGLVAIAFRVAGMDMAFTADVLRRGGAIVPANVELGRFTSVTRYLQPSSHFTFEDYVQRILLPQVRESTPAATVQSVARSSSLYALENSLRSDDRMLVITNEDDFILSAAELAWLRRVFGTRAHVAPNGGHLGNLETPASMRLVLEHLRSRLKSGDHEQTAVIK